MNMKDKLDALMNKGSNYKKPEEKRTYKPDERFFRFTVSKNKLPEELKKEKSISYEFALVPFSEGVNYLPMNRIAAVFGKDGSILKYEKPRLENFYTNSYIRKEHGSIRYEYLKDEMFYGLSSVTDKLKENEYITDPFALYTNYFLKNLKDILTEEEKKLYNIKRKETVLVQVIVIEDPVNPENNGKLKLVEITKQLFDTIQTLQIKKNEENNFNEAKELKSLEETEENKEKIETLIQKINSNILDKFDLDDKVYFVLNIDLTKDPRQNKELYTNVSMLKLSERLDDPTETYSLVDLVKEQKEKYVHKNLKDNLVSLGWEMNKIFEYKAFMDFYDAVKDSPEKLEIFNKFNKYNFDVNLYKEDYEPTIDLIKVEENQTLEVKEQPKEEHFSANKEEDIDFEEELDDGIPF